MKLELIQEAIKYSGGTHTVGDVVDGILDGRYFYLENETTMLVFEVFEFPRKKRIHIFLLAGDIANGHKLREQVETLGREIKADEVSLSGRKGWERILTDYTATHVTMVKKL